MSIDLMTRIIWREDIDTSEKMVLLAGADRAGDEGVFWYANATIARKASMTIRGVQKVINRLIDKGLMRKMHRHDSSNFYIIDVSKFPHCKPDQSSANKEPGIVEMLNQSFDFGGEHGSGGGEPCSGGGRTVFMSGVNGVHVRGEPGSPYTSNDTILIPDSILGEPSSIDDQIIDHVAVLWAALRSDHPILPACRMTKIVRDQIIARTHEQAPSRSGLAQAKALWDSVFEIIRANSFLCGRVKDFRVSLIWISGRKNFAKITGGQYAPDTNRPDRSSRSSIAAGKAAIANPGARRDTGNPLARPYERRRADAA